MNMKCALCKQALDTDSPYSVYGRNPVTFRHAWMHDLCAIEALESLHGQSAIDQKYEDRYDEYIQIEERERT
jgi:hypothetical protein